MKKIPFTFTVLLLGFIGIWPKGLALLDKRIRASQNYGATVCALSKQYDIPYSYLMALITQECSGNKPCSSRFESHIHTKLHQVKQGTRTRLDRNVTQDSLATVSTDQLVPLATSWGPFQLMGYQSIGLQTSLENIKGEPALEYGVIWIKKDYGHLLSKERYRDAFHWHNAGRPYPKQGKTKSATYVRNALQYMEYFSNDCQ